MFEEELKLLIKFVLLIYAAAMSLSYSAVQILHFKGW